MLIGMFHTRKDPEKVSRAYLLAAAAKMEGFDFFYFTSRDVNFEKRTISGLYYEMGAWHRKTFPFPDVWLNVAKPRSEKQQEVYNKLRKVIPYTGFNVGSKTEVYERIARGEVYKEHLIPYKRAKTPQDVLKFIDTYDRIILKPVIGHHGDDIYYIEKIYQGYLIKKDHDEFELSAMEIRPFLKLILKEMDMIVQKYIHSRTKEGIPYDIRLHLQKNGDGEWNIVYIQAKVGSKNKIITNVAKGGKIPPMDEFYKNQFGVNTNYMKQKLSQFAMDFTTHFESLYDYTFDELGIDVGIDEAMKIWIYEVNSRPGQSFMEGKAARRAVKYANYLAKKVRGENNETN